METENPPRGGSKGGGSDNVMEPEIGPINAVEEPPPDDSDPNSSNNEASDEDDSFQYSFKAFSNQWLHTQLTHKVSLAASNSMWNLAMKNVQNLMELKERDGVSKKIPQFLQVKFKKYLHIYIH